MSEYSFDSQSADPVPEFPSGGLPLAEGSATRPVLMPFETDSREAEALRGAIGFLFSLITSYDELIAAASAEGDSPADAESTPD